MANSNIPPGHSSATNEAPTLRDAEIWYNPWEGDEGNDNPKINYISPNDTKNSILDILKVSSDYLKIGTADEKNPVTGAVTKPGVGIYGYLYVPDFRTAPDYFAPYAPWGPNPNTYPVKPKQGPINPPYRELHPEWPLPFEPLAVPEPWDPARQEYDRDPGHVDPTTQQKMRTTPLGWRCLGPAGGSELTISNLHLDTPLLAPDGTVYKTTDVGAGAGKPETNGHQLPDAPPKEGDIWYNHADKLIWIYGAPGIGDVDHMTWNGPIGVPPGENKGDQLVWDPNAGMPAPSGSSHPQGQWVPASRFSSPRPVTAVPTNATNGQTTDNILGAGKVWMWNDPATLSVGSLPTLGGALSIPSGTPDIGHGDLFWYDPQGVWHVYPAGAPAGTPLPPTGPVAGQTMVWAPDNPKDPNGPGQWVADDGVPKGPPNGDMLVWVPDPSGGAGAGKWFPLSHIQWNPENAGVPHTYSEIIPPNDARPDEVFLGLPTGPATRPQGATHGLGPMFGNSLVWTPMDPNNADPGAPGMWLPGEGVPPGTTLGGDILVWDPTARLGKPFGGWSTMRDYVKPIPTDQAPTPLPTGGSGGAPQWVAGKTYQNSGTAPIPLPFTDGATQLPGGPATAQPGEFFWLDPGLRWHTAPTAPVQTTPAAGQALVFQPNDPKNPFGQGQWVPGEGVPPGEWNADVIIWDPKGGPAGLGGWHVDHTVGLTSTGPTGSNPPGTMLLWDPDFEITNKDGVKTGTKGAWVPWLASNPGVFWSGNLPTGGQLVGDIYLLAAQQTATGPGGAQTVFPANSRVMWMGSNWDIAPTGPVNGQVLVWDEKAGPTGPTGPQGGWVTRTQQFAEGTVSPLPPQWIAGSGVRPAGPPVANLGAATAAPGGTNPGDAFFIDQPVTPAQIPLLPDHVQQGDIIIWDGIRWSLPRVGTAYNFTFSAATPLNRAPFAQPAGGTTAVIQWIGDEWRLIEANTQGMWAPADPDLKVRWDAQSAKWILDMELPQGNPGNALEIEDALNGGAVGIGDQTFWFDPAGVTAAVFPPTGGPTKIWATMPAGAPTAASPEPNKVYVPVGATINAGDLLQWRSVTIDPGTMDTQGGIIGLSYKLNAGGGNAAGDANGEYGPLLANEYVTWVDAAASVGTLEADGTQPAPATPANGAIYKIINGDTAAWVPTGVNVGQYVRWENGQWIAYIPVPRWVRERGTAGHPTGYWQLAEQGTYAQLVAQAVLTGSGQTVPVKAATAFNAYAGGAAAHGDPQTGPYGPPDPDHDNIFASGVLLDPAKIVDDQGNPKPFIAVANFWNEDLSGIPTQYMCLLGYNPPDAGGHYATTGSYIDGAHLGLKAPGAAPTHAPRLYLPDGWVYIGVLKGIPGPAGEITSALSHTIPPSATTALGPAGHLMTQWELADATIALGGHPSYRILSFGIPAGLPAIFDHPPNLTVHDLPPHALPTAAVYPADLAKNIWELEFSLPRATEILTGLAGGPAASGGAANVDALDMYEGLKLAQNTPTPPNAPPAGTTNDALLLYKIGSVIPVWASANPPSGSTVVIPNHPDGTPLTPAEQAARPVPGAQPGDWMWWNGAAWTIVAGGAPTGPGAPAAPTLVPVTADAGNQGAVMVDAGTGNIWQSMPSGADGIPNPHWHMMGGVGGPPGPAGQLVSITGNDLPPQLVSATGDAHQGYVTAPIIIPTGPSGPTNQPGLRGTPEQRIIDFHIPAGIPAVFTPTLEVLMTPPGPTSGTGTATLFLPTGATAGGPDDHNIWKLSFSLPRGSEITSGLVTPPATGQGFVPTLTVAEPVAVAPLDLPTPATGLPSPMMYLVGAVIPINSPAGTKTGDYLVWNDLAKTWDKGPAPAGVATPATVDNQGNVIIDSLTGDAWYSRNLGTTLAPDYQWVRETLLQGPVGQLEVSDTGVVDDPDWRTTGLLPPVQAETIGAEVINRGTDTHAILDIVLPRASRWFTGAVPPPGVNFSKKHDFGVLPATGLPFTVEVRDAQGVAKTRPIPNPPPPPAPQTEVVMRHVEAGDTWTLPAAPAAVPQDILDKFRRQGLPDPNPGDRIMIAPDGESLFVPPAPSLPIITGVAGNPQVNPLPWDYYLDLTTGDVFLYEPSSAAEPFRGTLTGAHTPLPNLAGLYRTQDPIPNALKAAVPTLVDGDYVRVALVGAVMQPSKANPPVWTATPGPNSGWSDARETLKGPRGDRGPGIRMRGEWQDAAAKGMDVRVTGTPVGADSAPNTPYEPGDIVIYNGISYMITQPNPTTRPDGTAVP